MTLIKRNYPVMPSINKWFDDFFADDFDLFDRMQTVPSVNIKERDTDFIIELAAPGFGKEDFEIDLDNNVLTISNKKKEEKVEEKARFTKREFNYREFKRVFTLPDSVETDSIKAECKNGILEISISKKPEAQVKPKRKIDII